MVEYINTASFAVNSLIYIVKFLNLLNLSIFMKDIIYQILISYKYFNYILFIQNRLFQQIDNNSQIKRQSFVRNSLITKDEHGGWLSNKTNF